MRGKAEEMMKSERERQRRGDVVEVLMQMMMFSNRTYLSFTAECGQISSISVLS